MRILLVAVTLVCAACAPAASLEPSPTVTPSASASASATSTLTQTPTPTPTCVDRTLAAMTEDQRIGQLFLLGLAGDQLGAQETDAIRSRHLGSVWFVEQTNAGVAAVRAVADAVQALATGDTTAGVGFFVAANQEGGIIQSLKGPGFGTIPTALDQSSLDTAVLRDDARAWGADLAAAGVNLNFAPVVDVVPPGMDSVNEPIGVLQRGYGHDVATVSTHAIAFLDGMRDAGIATTAKHFPGLGQVRGNTDFIASVSDDVLTAGHPDLGAFRAAIDDGVPFVMVALATYTKIDPDHVAVFSPVVMRDLLRTKLGFTGAVMSDDLGATAAVAEVPAGQRGVDFIAAGGDLIVSKTVAPALAMADAIRARASQDAAFAARVDDAARRVLLAKQRSSLVRC